MNDSLFLLDGYSLIYRSYFAFIRNPLTNERGENTSAIFGFFRTFFSLFYTYNPCYCAVVLDSLTPTFRHEQYPEYKATRDKAPQDLDAQVPLIEEILDALGVPTLRVNGFEADDIIATLASGCSREKRPSYILSGDKDLLQLVGEWVKVLQSGEKGEYREIGRSEVYEKVGVYPEQILDYLALVGDSSDNIPGVRGIGPKTAANLLHTYASLDSIYQHLDDIPAGQRKKLEAEQEQCYLSKQLVTLRYDVPLHADIEDLRIAALDTEAAVPLLLKQNIKTLAEELGGSDAVKEQMVTQPEQGVYSAVLTEEELESWREKVKQKKWFAFDVETNNLDALAAEPVGFSLSVVPGEACYIPLKAAGSRCLPEEAVRSLLEDILTDETLHCIGQNIKYDYKVMKRWGITIRNIRFDTMVAAWVLDSQSGSYGMDNLAARFLQYRTIHFDEVVAKGSTFDTVPLEEATSYAAEDADITYRLYERFYEQLRERNLEQLFYEIEIKLVTILAEMEMAGINLNTEVLAAYSQELARELARIEDEVYKLCGERFNINSTKQLQAILFEKRKLQPVKKIKTGYSTDNAVLEELSREDPVPGLVLQHRGLSKLKSTYVDTLPRLVNPHTRRLHTHFRQTGTATGRLSSRDPNLQNIPIKTEEGRKIRSAFVPSPGNLFLSGDYSQIELVVLAHLSGDPALCEAFRRGMDVHSQTGSLIFGVPVEEVSTEQRRVAKIINFGIMYGMSSFRLSRELDIPRQQADEFINAYFEKYSHIKSFIEKTIREVEENSVVSTILGRERRIQGINSKNRAEKKGAERVAINTPIQGSAADIVKLAMISITARLHQEGYRSRLLLQVHDELIFEVPEEELEPMKQLVAEEMEQAVTLDVPLKVSLEVGRSWGELH
jgi:DNA polymerase-1